MDCNQFDLCNVHDACFFVGNPGCSEDKSGLQLYKLYSNRAPQTWAYEIQDFLSVCCLQ